MVVVHLVRLLFFEVLPFSSSTRLVAVLGGSQKLCSPLVQVGTAAGEP